MKTKAIYVELNSVRKAIDTIDDISFVEKAHEALNTVEPLTARDIAQIVAGLGADEGFFDDDRFDNFPEVECT